MKKLFITFLLIIATAASANAGNMKGNYLELKLNGVVDAAAGYLGNDLGGVGGMLSFGSNYRSARWLYFRTELEFSYESVSNKFVEFSPFGLLINFYADFGLKEWLVRPFIGAGFGGKYIAASIPDSDSAGMALDVQAGAIYQISDDWAATAAFRYDTMTGLDYDIRTYAITAGIQWRF
ncbi:MAG: porin family protein [Rickettsiales bacterium]|jgi:opacity protein-like surface antigen|nr:porin family protein [Rickettsiales bacterium]